MPKQDIAVRFWNKVDKSGDCWIWTAYRDPNGYGRVAIHRGKEGTFPYLAHRMAWELTNGNIPEGKFLCHRCDKPACVNPEHMFIGTQTDNMQDMWRKGRAKPGHMVGEKHGMAKLTEDAVREIRAASEPPAYIAKRYSISRRQVRDIIARRVWKHVA